MGNTNFVHLFFFLVLFGFFFLIFVNAFCDLFILFVGWFFFLLKLECLNANMAITEGPCKRASQANHGTNRYQIWGCRSNSIYFDHGSFTNLPHLLILSSVISDICHISKVNQLYSSLSTTSAKGTLNHQTRIRIASSWPQMANRLKSI